MRHPSCLLLLLMMIIWALVDAIHLAVQQSPPSLSSWQGSQVTLTCQVMHSQAWERIRMEWIRDGDPVCQRFVTNGSLSAGECGPRGQLSWTAPVDRELRVELRLELRLEPVSVNDSGCYVCRATLEIPELQEAEGNCSELTVCADSPEKPACAPGLVALLAAGATLTAALALGAVMWGHRRCTQEDAGSPMYSNVLYRPRETPKVSEVWTAQEEAQTAATGDHDTPTIHYSSPFPQPAPGHKPPVPTPRSGHPVPVARLGLGPDASG